VRRARFLSRLIPWCGDRSDDLMIRKARRRRKIADAAERLAACRVSPREAPMAKTQRRSKGLAREIGAVLAAKVLALAALYFAFFASKPALPGAARWLFGP
jgi:hypothetical protein